MARSKFIWNKKKVEPANNTPVVSTKSIAKLHCGLVKKVEMKTLKYAEMVASLETKIAAVEQEKIRNNKYADRLSLRGVAGSRDPGCFPQGAPLWGR